MLDCSTAHEHEREAEKRQLVIGVVATRVARVRLRRCEDAVAQGGGNCVVRASCGRRRRVRGRSSHRADAKHEAGF